MNTASRPIALITDFGTDDYFVGAMKGVILGINRQAVIVDITHNIEPQSICSAAFVLSACWLDFPEGTIFTAVVDPGVGTARRAMVVEAAGRFLVAPDNGLVTFAFDEAVAGGPFRCFEIVGSQRPGREASGTFHGRDIFAPAAARLSLGADPAELWPVLEDPVRLPINSPHKDDRGLTAEIIHVDHFGNLITNLRPSDLPENFEMSTGGRTIRKLASTFGEASPGELLAYCGSSGLVEIGVNLSSAASLLSAGIGDVITVRAKAGSGG